MDWIVHIQYDAIAGADSDMYAFAGNSVQNARRKLHTN